MPSGSEWAYEIKHDGFRFLAVRQRKQVHIYSRGGHDWAERLPAITEAMRALPIRSQPLKPRYFNQPTLSEAFAAASLCWRTFKLCGVIVAQTPSPLSRARVDSSQRLQPRCRRSGAFSVPLIWSCGMSILTDAIISIGVALAVVVTAHFTAWSVSFAPVVDADFTPCVQCACSGPECQASTD